MIGQIKKIITDKGFGFIKGEDHKDYFFHRSALNGEVFEHLNIGQRVNYDAKKKDGKDRAENITCV